MEFRTLVHIGPYKTGSTSLQEFLSRNHDWLLERGLLYPKAGRQIGRDKLDRAHNPLFHAARLEDHVAYQRFVDDLGKEVAEHSPRILILSSEVASRESLTQNFYDLINDTIPGSTRDILLYVRRQDDLLSSRYSQRVKTGNLRWPKSIQHLNSPKFLDHRLRIENLKRALPEFGVVVRSFDRDKKRLIPNFLEQVGIERIESANPAPRMNSKRPWGVTWLGRYLNVLPQPMARYTIRQFIKMDGHLQAKGIDLLGGIGKPLSYQQRRNIIEQYADSNAWLASEYFDGLDPFLLDTETHQPIRNQA